MVKLPQIQSIFTLSNQPGKALASSAGKLQVSQLPAVLGSQANRHRALHRRKAPYLANWLLVFVSFARLRCEINKIVACRKWCSML